MSTRRTRKSIALMAIAALLFVQTAMVAHACVARVLAESSAAASMAGMADMDPEHSRHCDQADSGTVSRCLQHCDSVQQSLDHHQPPHADPAVIVVYRLDAPENLSLQSMLNHSRGLLSRVTAPPLSVRNCCFRT